MGRNFFQWFIISIIIITAFLFSNYFIDLKQAKANSVNNAGDITVEIKPGNGLNEIAQQLKNQKLISFAWFFKIVAFITGQADRLKPGEYFFNRDISLLELIKALVNGPQEDAITIAPGLTLKEVDDLLNSAKIIKPNSLINFNVRSLSREYLFLKKLPQDYSSPEGFLLPDTYRFHMSSSPETVVRKFLDNLQAKISDSEELTILNDSDNILQLFTIASLLEKEVPDFNERRLVAGILEKRLKAKMPLQVDATVIYAACQGRFVNCPVLQQSDYRIDSPYNTYLYSVLPPTPISNPSIEALEAVVNPQQSNYWYYLSNPKNKKTIFSKNFDEHNRNRIKYLLNK